jgi:hypothetical protein
MAYAIGNWRLYIELKMNVVDKVDIVDTVDIVDGGKEEVRTPRV